MKRVLLGLGFLFLGGIACATQVQASEDYVYIPDKDMRNAVVGQIETINNSYQLPNQAEMSKLTFLGTNPARTIEGLQYASNVENLNVNPVENIVDYRPISNLKNLKTYYTYNSMVSDTNSIIDIRPFSQLDNVESLYFGYANITDLTPLENLNHLTSFFSQGSTITLPKTYISKENKMFIIESPVKYSSQFTNIDVQANGGELACEFSNNAIIIRNLDPNIQEITLSMNGQSDSFDWNEGFSSTMSFSVPVSWY